MPLFDRYLIVDWSANNTPKTGSDSIWLCLVDLDAGILALDNIATRSAAMGMMSGHIQDALNAGKRLFAGFDFAFGYPHGAAEVIAGEPGWHAVWSKLSTLIEDNEDNASNRFAVGGQLNQQFEEQMNEMPFWGHPHQHDGRYPGLSTRRPEYEGMPEKRFVDREMKSAQPVWKLAYTGSVGSQTLLGIPRLEDLRSEFGGELQIWPFETRFAERLDAPIIIAEIYPSMLSVSVGNDETKDAAQVRTMAQTFACLDRDDRFDALLATPDCLSADQCEAVLAEEGWMVGVGHTFETAVGGLCTVSDYIQDPAQIYSQSFATVRRESDLSRFPGAIEDVAIRLIHSCGMIDIVDDLEFTPNAAAKGQAALRAGCSIFCDVEMVRSGIIERLLPSKNPLICTLNDERVPDHAKAIGNTRSAAAVDFWGDDLEGAIVVIGNAPTALFRLLERLDEGAPKPALIVGIPVGFVGAVESKQALAARSSDIDSIVVHGRRGGSAMASAVVNALAGGLA